MVAGGCVSLLGTTGCGLPGRFAMSYREFILRYGTAEVANEDIAGFIGPEFENGGWPNAVWLNLTNRREFGRGARYFFFYNWGDGTDSALDLERRDAAGERPVVEAHAGAFEAHGKERTPASQRSCLSDSERR
jgi:hypothetical protein